MIIKDVTWHKEFNIGVDVVDEAHQQLFSIVRRLLKVNSGNANDRRLCVEGINYFKNYAIKHFAEEEAYMLSINYDGYTLHKRLHDNMRDKTLPAIERRMEESNYSPESIEQFLGICIGWLTGHIMIEDMAITGKTSSRWSPDNKETINKVLEQSLIQIIEKIFGLKARIFSSYYNGESFGKAVNYRMDYVSLHGRHTWVVLSMEEKLILNTVGTMLGVLFSKVDNTVLSAIKQISQQILRSIGPSLYATGGSYHLENDTLISDDAMQQLFEKSHPKYSILLETDLGCFAFCADERPGANRSRRAPVQTKSDSDANRRGTITDTIIP
ncbi:MAG: hemerythrin domain-containing protein [Lachnospiraceae bacterium]|nr:hemerythrin domain-containing protein [Lachnospiraceae bacterium]